jgi:hypothetical protein
MKKLFLLLALLLQLHCYATYKKSKKPEPVFHRHTIGFAMTNAVSSAFYNGTHGPTETFIRGTYTYGGINTLPYVYIQYRPSYTWNLNVNYSYGISKTIRIETGVSYLIQGLFSSEVTHIYPSIGMGLDNANFKSSLQIPLHIQIKKLFKNSFLTFTFGPDFAIPFFDNYIVENPNIPIKNWYVSETSNSSTISENTSMGFDLKVGYEMQITKRATCNIGPVANFNNLILFHHDADNFSILDDRQLFRYYVGLDLAFNFGLEKHSFYKKSKPTRTVKHQL